jgi:hypothetical protein
MDTSLSSEQNSGLLFLSLTRSRQAWTTCLFKRYDGTKGTGPAANDGLIGSCTVVIGPHVFPDTRFFRTNERKPEVEKIEENQSQDTSSKQLIFEFRENPTDRWILPEDAVVEALNMSPPYEVSIMC